MGEGDSQHLGSRFFNPSGPQGQQSMYMDSSAGGTALRDSTFNLGDLIPMGTPYITRTKKVKELFNIL